MFFFAIEATNLSVTADELQMTYFKCKSLQKVIMVVTARHFLAFLTLCIQPNSVKIQVKITLQELNTSNCRD